MARFWGFGKLGFGVMAILPFCWAPGSSASELVHYVDRNGVLHFVSRPVRRPISRAPRGKPRISKREVELVPLIEKISQLHQVDSRLVRAMVRVESDFRKHAVSTAGAKGLMQLMPGISRHYGVKNVFDAEQNLRGGIGFLKHLQTRYRNDLQLMLAAYHAGETAVAAAGGVPEIASTRQYVVDVLRQYRWRGGKLRSQGSREPRQTRRRPPRSRKPVDRPIRVRVDSLGRIEITNLR